MWSSRDGGGPGRAVAAALAVAVALVAGIGPLAGPAAADQSAPGVRSPQYQAPPALTAAGSVADLVVSLTITPNQPGVNGFMVRVASSRRPPPAPVDGVRLTLAGAAVPLASVAAGQYAGSGRLVRSGAVRVTVAISRDGGRLDVPIPWSVGPAAPPTRSAPAPGAGPGALAGPGLVGAVLVPPLLGALVLGARRLRSRRPRTTAPVDGADPMLEALR
jgi:copper transport protein